MQKAMPTTQTVKDNERKGFLVISPILIGSVAYGASITFLILANLFDIMF